jgi:hypothetical protein
MQEVSAVHMCIYIFIFLNNTLMGRSIHVHVPQKDRGSVIQKVNSNYM